MIRTLAIILALSGSGLTGCVPTVLEVQKEILISCLDKCKDGNAACIQACRSLVNGDCK